MNGIAMNAAVDYLSANCEQYAERLARLRAEMRSALEAVEVLIRAQALASGVPEKDVDGRVRDAAAMALRRAVEDVVQTHKSPGVHTPTV